MSHTAMTIQHIRTQLIDESPSNPRNDYGDIAGLAASIDAHGQQQPIVVRPHGERFEVVFGHRRLRAIRLLQRPTIEAIVREVADEDLLTQQIIENLQREDPHPLDEADGIHRLRATMTIEDIARQIGRSPRFVAERARLHELSPLGRRCLHAGLLTIGAAIEVARLGATAIQDRAIHRAIRLPSVDEDVEQALPDPEDVDVPSAAKMRTLIRACITVPVSNAPWPLGSREFGPRCTGCPMRSSKQPELFDDPATDDQCLEPNCYSLKLAAFAAGAAGEHGTVKHDASAELWQARRGWSRYLPVDAPGGYTHPATGVAYSPAALMQEHGIGTTVLLDQDERQVLVCVDTYAIVQALRASADPSEAPATNSISQSWKEQQYERNRQVEILGRVHTRAIAKTIVCARPISLHCLRPIALALCMSDAIDDDTAGDICTQMGLAELTDEADEPLPIETLQYVASMCPEPFLPALIRTLTYARHGPSNYGLFARYGLNDSNLRLCGEAWGIDLEALWAEAEAEQEAGAASDAA